MNNNSMEAFKSERDNGTITKRQQQVVDFLHLVKGATGRQISKAVPGGWKRMKDLCDMGLVRVCGNVKDPDTNKMVSVYELTGQQMLLTTPSVKKPTRKELEATIDSLKLELAQARAMIANLMSRGVSFSMPVQRGVKIFGVKIW